MNLGARRKPGLSFLYVNVIFMSAKQNAVRQTLEVVHSRNCFDTDQPINQPYSEFYMYPSNFLGDRGIILAKQNYRCHILSSCTLYFEIIIIHRHYV